MFHKQGTPQPMKIASGLCEICKKNNASCLVNGQMICEECREKIEKKEWLYGRLSSKNEQI